MPRGGAVNAGRPISQDHWPGAGPVRRFLELLDGVHRANGTKSLRAIARAMNLSGPSRVSVLLNGKSLPASEDQARALVRALGGSAEDIKRGAWLYLQALSAEGDRERAGRRDRGKRAARLATLRREASARRSAWLRAAAVPGEKLDELIKWMDEVADPDLRVPRGELRVLVGPMGAGKTEHAHRWYLQAMQEACDDESVEFPVWLDARQAVPNLRAALTALLTGGEPAGRCYIVLDGLNAVGAEQGRLLLDEARQLVGYWPNTSILVTTRPGPQLTLDEELRPPPWPEGRGIQLVELLTGNYLPSRLAAPETVQALRSPLSAHALAARLGSGQRTDVSRWELLASLADQAIQASRADNPPPHLWPLLMRLACRVLDSGAPVASAQFGTHPETWQVTDSGLVSQDSSGRLSFVLPVFEQHFGAEALRHSVVSIETAATSQAFPRWRYSIAFAIGAASPSDAEQLMKRLARANPGAASWTLAELRTEATGTAGETLVGPAAEPTWPSGVKTAMALGQWLRGAQDAWLDGFGPLGPQLVRHATGGQPAPWGIWWSGDWMSVADAREPNEVAVTEMPGPWPGITGGSGWQRVRGGGVPAGPLGRWHWTQDRLREELARGIMRGTLPCPPDSPLEMERLWLLAQLVTIGRSSPGHEPIPVQMVKDTVDKMLIESRNTVRSEWRTSRYVVDQNDVRWLHERLASIGEPELHRPAPRPDKFGPSGLQYSPDQLAALIAHTLKTAVTSYRQIAETCFPSFGTALNLYSALPAGIEGIVKTGEDPGWGVGITCVFRPAPRTRSGDESPEVHVALTQADLMTRTGQVGVGPVNSATAVRYCDPFEPNLARPATCLAYTWLAEDLYDLGWAASRRGCFL